MASFTDEIGREWRVQLHPAKVREIQERFGILLTDLRSDAFNQLSMDPILLVNTLYLICKQQADELGLSDDNFGELMVPVIDQAVVALEVAICELFPSGRRSLLKSLHEKQEAMQRKAMETAIQELDANQERVNQMTKSKVRKMMTELLEAEGSPGDTST